jgi:hypothetical protein
VNFKRAASILTISLTVAMGAPASFASDKDDVVGVVNRYLDNLSTEHPRESAGRHWPMRLAGFNPRRISAA